jgi:radical SAM protein with 4Fe4S-binding SPASM domain
MSLPNAERISDTAYPGAGARQGADSGLQLSEWAKNRKPLSAPIMINLELTTGCNLQCRHCYNFWREDPASFKDNISTEKLDTILENIITSGVYHVVLTGGEPMLNFNVLEYALKRLSAHNISTSCNSNLMLVSEDRIKRLRDAGLDHILTSLNSFDPETNDFMMNKPGTLARVIDGIKKTVAGGIRVSANMVISGPNAGHVYETGRLCAEIGVQKLFATRLVPAVTAKTITDTELELGREEARDGLEQLFRVRADFGIEVGTLINYPLCFLGDLERWDFLVGRGCPAQTGNRMVVNADGMSHACTHEETPYGSVLETGIRDVFAKMSAWHDGSYRYEGCNDCPYQKVCYSGCRMAAHAYFGEMEEKDPLYIHHSNITNHFKIFVPQELLDGVKAGAEFTVPERIRFREEPGYHTINVRWANAFPVPSEVANFLIERQKAQAPFQLADLPTADGYTDLVYLIYKDAVRPVRDDLDKVMEGMTKFGASVNPWDLPAGLIRAC